MEENIGLDGTQLALLSLFISIFGPIFIPPLIKFIDRKINYFRDRKEIEKISSESEKLTSESKKADQETITEKNESDRLYVETARGLMKDMENVFEARVKAMEERQKLELAEIARKQDETDRQLEIIREENQIIKLENQKIKSESLELHQENLKLNGVINKLQLAIKGLKKLIEKLMSGINKLISTYEENHKDELIPWKPILTDEEQLLFQSDFDIKDLKSYKNE